MLNRRIRSGLACLAPFEGVHIRTHDESEFVRFPSTLKAAQFVHYFGLEREAILRPTSSQSGIRRFDVHVIVELVNGTDPQGGIHV